MKLIKKKDKTGLGSYYIFVGKFARGTVWYDGSGELYNKQIYMNSGSYSDKVKEIESKAKLYFNVLKELKQLAPKIKFSRAEKRGE